MHLLEAMALVALGSALGGLTRWSLGLGVTWLVGMRFPFATFLINITGCFFLGWLLACAGGDEVLRLLFGVGFAGSYTTFSTFGFESDKLLQSGDGLLGMLYIAGSVALGLLAVRLGMLLGA